MWHMVTTVEELECLQIVPFNPIISSILWHRGHWDCLQRCSFTHWVPLRDIGSWKSQWFSGEPGSLVYFSQVRELVMQFVYSNANNSSFLQNKAMGVSWPHLYGCPKAGSNTLLRCADVRKLLDADKDRAVPCAFPDLQDVVQHNTLCFTTPSSAEHPCCHQWCATKLYQVTRLFGIQLKKFRHRPKVEGGLHGKQVLLRDTSFHSPLLGITPTWKIWAVHKSEANWMMAGGGGRNLSQRWAQAELQQMSA